MEKALDALRRVMDCWTNPPLWRVRDAERDARWGDLRQHPEFVRILDEKRRRIGPIHGDIHYYIGWD